MQPSDPPADRTGPPCFPRPRSRRAVLAASGDVRVFRREAGGTLGPDRARWRHDRHHASAYASPVVAAGHVLVVGPTGLVALAPPDDG